VRTRGNSKTRDSGFFRRVQKERRPSNYVPKTEETARERSGLGEKREGRGTWGGGGGKPGLAPNRREKVRKSGVNGRRGNFFREVSDIAHREGRNPLKEPNKRRKYPETASGKLKAHEGIISRTNSRGKKGDHSVSRNRIFQSHELWS